MYPPPSRSARVTVGFLRRCVFVVEGPLFFVSKESLVFVLGLRVEDEDDREDDDDAKIVLSRKLCNNEDICMF